MESFVIPVKSCDLNYMLLDNYWSETTFDFIYYILAHFTENQCVCTLRMDNTSVFFYIFTPSCSPSSGFRAIFRATVRALIYIMTSLSSSKCLEEFWFRYLLHPVLLVPLVCMFLETLVIQNPMQLWANGGVDLRHRVANSCNCWSGILTMKKVFMLKPGKEVKLCSWKNPETGVLIYEENPTLELYTFN